MINNGAGSSVIHPNFGPKIGVIAAIAVTGAKKKL
jgi:hypothetical protein